MFKICADFNQRNIDEIIPEVIYFYFFHGLSLTEIEKKLFNTEKYHGWISKSLLNYHGISTIRDNKGIYIDVPVSEAVEELLASNNIKHLAVAKLLKDKYL